MFQCLKWFCGNTYFSFWFRYECNFYTLLFHWIFLFSYYFRKERFHFFFIVLNFSLFRYTEFLFYFHQTFSAREIFVSNALRTFSPFRCLLLILLVLYYSIRSFLHSHIEWIFLTYFFFQLSRNCFWRLNSFCLLDKLCR